MQLCLASSSRTAGRASNLGSYIREGSSGPAVLRVTLVNEGYDAYKPEVYGKRITIERKIVKVGGSTFYIKNIDGEVRITYILSIAPIILFLFIHY